MVFNSNRTKVQLKLAVTRLKLLQSKKASLNAVQRREIATLLEKGKVESARIRVEHIIREDYTMEALEMLEIYCEMLLARFGLLEQMKTLDPSIAEAAHSIVYAAPVSQVDELLVVRSQLILKFGKQFEKDSMENKEGCVNERLVEKMRIKAPAPKLVGRYLTEIAHNFNVNWGEPDDFADSSLIGADSLTIPFSPLPEVAPQAMPQQPTAPQQTQQVPPPGSYNQHPQGSYMQQPQASYPQGGPYMGQSPMQPMGPGPSNPPSSQYPSDQKEKYAPSNLSSQPVPPRNHLPAPAASDNFDLMFPSVPTTQPGSSNGSGGGGPRRPPDDDDDMPDFDDLTKRFEALKRR